MNTPSHQGHHFRLACHPESTLTCLGEATSAVMAGSQQPTAGLAESTSESYAAWCSTMHQISFVLIIVACC